MATMSDRVSAYRGLRLATRPAGAVARGVLGLVLAVAACSKENAVDQSSTASISCIETKETLTSLCPPGTGFEASGSASAGNEVCPDGAGEVKGSDGKPVGVCKATATCSVRCKALCECGVQSISGNDIKCAPCATCKPGEASCSGATLLLCGPDGKQAPTDCQKLGQVCSAPLGQCVAANKCGNGVCEGSEDEAKCPQDCKKACGDGVCSAVETAASCPEDCAKATCGNGKCEKDEQSACPQDCGAVCVSNAKYCVGPKLFICQPDGKAEKTFDCADFGQTCGKGACVPAGVCGNGTCESSDPAGCADCATDCGNGTCDPGETVETCGNDCKKAQCGDQVCSVSEAGTPCADCAASCGNGACDAGESRSTCPKDCGYCGDGKCPNGEETSVQPPPKGVEYCPQDCVKTGGCAADADCDDGIECTLDKCVGGKCSYDLPQDKSGTCGGGQLCVKFFGCCPDADGDGFPCCGGDPDGTGCKAVSAQSDCRDKEKESYPGAPEQCDGIDRNCNGKNEPTVIDAVEITRNSANDFDNKERVAIAWNENKDGGRYSIAYLSKPGGTPAVVIDLLDRNAAILPTNPRIISSDKTVVPQDAVNSPDSFEATFVGSAYSPKYDQNKGAFAVTWGNAVTPWSIEWVDLDTNKKELVAKHVAPISVGAASSSSGHKMHWYGGAYVAPRNGGGLFINEAEQPKIVTNVASSFSFFPYKLTEGPSAGEEGFLNYGQQVGTLPFVPEIRAFDLAGNPKTPLPVQGIALGGKPFYATIANDIGSDCCSRMVWDGRAITGVSKSTDGLRYERTSLSGPVTLSTALSNSTALYPLDLIALPDKEIVALLATDGLSVYFSLTKQDGSVLLPLKPVAGGNTIKRGFVFWDGETFRFFWTALNSKNVRQVYTSTISCE